MKRIIIALFFIAWSSPLLSHHYKGLPHYSYFENYPQIPILEFINRQSDYELFITIYNFQGLNLDLVTSPDDVRFYTYIFDVNKGTAHLGQVDFEVKSHGKTVYEADNVSPEQESIYLVQDKIKEQDDLLFIARFKNAEGKMIKIETPIQITESFTDKYGLYIAIALFFASAIGLKMFTNKRAAMREQETNAA